MANKKGFTLLEILIVLVIVMGVFLFALPAHKRAQQRNKFAAAQGILLDLGSAINNFKRDLAKFAPGVSFEGNLPTDERGFKVAADCQDTENSNYTAAANLSKLSSATNDHMPYILFARQYMEPIPFDNGNTYKGYIFLICSGAETAGPCLAQPSASACMFEADHGQTEETDGYWGACVMPDLTIYTIHSAPEE